MLYQLDVEAEPSVALDPVEFSSLSELGGIEKDLERILAENLFGVLFEDARLLPIFQERPRQEEADIYAVNEDGDLFIFELKRGSSGRGAVSQLLRYGEQAGQWEYERLDRMYRKYVSQEEALGSNLREAHQNTYQRQELLPRHEFNRRQHFRVVGHAANDDLVDAVDYWKTHGLKIDFVPYRIYEIGDKRYFEFFSLPYDRHRNPADKKGVLFDTNASYDENSVWEMMEESRVAAYGGAKRFVDHVERADLIFFYHTGKGIVAAGRVTGPLRKTEKNGTDEWYRDVEFETPVPERSDGIQRAMSASEIKDATEKSFFWARTIKVPYLDLDEAEELLEKVNEKLRPS